MTMKEGVVSQNTKTQSKNNKEKQIGDTGVCYQCMEMEESQGLTCCCVTPL